VSTLEGNDVVILRQSFKNNIVSLVIRNTNDIKFRSV